MRGRLSSSVVPHDPCVIDNFVDGWWVGGEWTAVQWQHCHDSRFCGSSTVGDLEEEEGRKKRRRRAAGAGEGHITLQRDSCLHQRQLNLMGGAKEVRWRGGDVIFGRLGSR